jgi:hypothetical protein
MIEHEEEEEDDIIISPKAHTEGPIRDTVNIWSIYEPDITRIVYMVQW